MANTRSKPSSAFPDVTRQDLENRLRGASEGYKLDETEAWIPYQAPFFENTLIESVAFSSGSGRRRIDVRLTVGPTPFVAYSEADYYCKALAWPRKERVFPNLSPYDEMVNLMATHLQETIQSGNFDRIESGAEVRVC